jgi:holin-like protein
MKNAIYSVLVVVLCLSIGKLITAFIGGLPASLYGMIIFTLLLHFQLFNANKIERSIEWALQNMGVCFVPAGVGIINHFELIKAHGLTIVFIVFITTFLLMTLVGLWYQLLINRRHK